MARSFSIESAGKAIAGVFRAFAVSRNGKSGAAARTPSAVATPRTLEVRAENPFPDETARTVVFSHHVSFEQTLNGLVGDIRRLAPVMVVTGEAGTGKTVLVRRAMAGLGADIIPILHSDATSTFKDFLDSACQQLRLANLGEHAQPEDLFQLFWDRLLAQHARARSLVVFADDAQNMSEALLSKLALLSKWTKSGKHVLQLVLVGLPSLPTLVQKLVRRDLISEDYPIHRLTPLNPEEMRAFIALQLSAAGGAAKRLFSAESLEKIAGYSQGIPRSILTLCNLAVLKARLENLNAITPDLIDQVAHAAAINGEARDAAEPDTAGDVQPVSPDHPRLVPVSRPTNNQEESQMTRVENLNKILKKLQSESPGIEASALISEDGLMIASALSPELDDTRVGGMTATLLNLGTRAATELRRGEVQEVIVRGDEGYAVMVSAGRGVLLLVLANESTKLGLIFFDMREAVKSINQVL